MSRLDDKSPEFQTLLADACRDDAPPEQLQALERMAADPDSMRVLVDYLLLDAELKRLVRGRSHADKCLASLGFDVADDATELGGEDRQTAPAFPRAGPGLFTPPAISGGGLPSTTGFLADHYMVFSYLVAAACIAVAALVGSLLHVSHDYRDFAQDNSRKRATSGSTAPQHPDLVFVGRVTGMKDCRWADPKTETYAGAFVSLGRIYALSSGLMEITYCSGAKVILEGPCRYEVESAAGGFLALGKLTAKVESGEWRVERGQRSEVRGQRSEHSPLSTLHSPLFTVRTPTAVVTDLGTEFGVEVDKSGDMQTHVFQGTVEICAINGPAALHRNLHPDISGRGGEDRIIKLVAGEMARVGRDNSGQLRLTRCNADDKQPVFRRWLVEQLDLLDVIAGGNGMGQRREWGINPVNGDAAPKFVGQNHAGAGRDRSYHPVVWHRFIDGVFVPDGRAGSVQVDSVGHAFDGFPPTYGIPWTSIWSRAAEIQADDPRMKDGNSWIYALGQGERFMPTRRGLLGMHANVGVTFNLEEIRQTYRGFTPKRFRAVAGLGNAKPFYTEIDASADIWVLVDGRVKLKRTGIRPQDDPIVVDVELGGDARFLTLASTDGGNGKNGEEALYCDWVVFGDPRLEMTPESAQNGMAHDPLKKRRTSQ